MTMAKQILDSKGHDVWSIGPDEFVIDAIRLMADKGIGALLIMEGEKLVGIVSERDYARKVILQGRSSQQTQVKDIMTISVLCARPQQTVEECLTLMTDKRVRHLPVVDGERVDGMLSIGDLVKAIIAEQEFTIKQLEHYING
ncbi:MAG: CBS domain-containing protein [Gammaproteobacteria bacterium]|nr:CBS domain-containing protein [Gammaproteobacteria bacterium]